MDISQLLNCRDRALISKIEGAIANFCKLPANKQYRIGFSGGKDSHAVLAIYFLYLLLDHPPLDIEVVFADTYLETKDLYVCIDKAFDWCREKSIPVKRVVPEKSYWYFQFVTGYPVPDKFNRWCTKFLKVLPLSSQDTAMITGRHFGESTARDQRLTCGSSGECGTDMIKDSYDPIIDFTNSNVWDFLLHSDGILLYEGVFGQLQSTYNANEETNGSLRMGCFMCPVVSKNTIRCNDPSYYPIRLALEKLRQGRRIRNPIPKKSRISGANKIKIPETDYPLFDANAFTNPSPNPKVWKNYKEKKRLHDGAIYVGDRREVWQDLDKRFLIANDFITWSEIDEIDYWLFATDGLDCYPRSYSREWVESEHKRIEKLSIQLQLI